MPRVEWNLVFFCSSCPEPFLVESPYTNLVAVLAENDIGYRFQEIQRKHTVGYEVYRILFFVQAKLYHTTLVHLPNIARGAPPHNGAHPSLWYKGMAVAVILRRIPPHLTLRRFPGQLELG